jgi:hypothetical protein
MLGDRLGDMEGETLGDRDGDTLGDRDGEALPTVAGTSTFKTSANPSSSVPTHNARNLVVEPLVPAIISESVDCSP